jgi:hypothetical protein
MKSMQYTTRHSVDVPPSHHIVQLAMSVMRR